jgi:hypothetical protein
MVVTIVRDAASSIPIGDGHRRRDLADEAQARGKNLSRRDNLCRTNLIFRADYADS